MAERSNDLVFILKDGSEVETSFWPPYNTAEQIAFEEKFKCSFLAVEQAAAEMRRAALAADGPDSIVDPVQAYQIRWILYFGWRRARPAVAPKFADFIDEQLEDWYFKTPPKAELEKPEDDDIVDAEVLPEGVDPLVAQMQPGASAEDGRLDPTEVPAPA